MRSSRLSSLSVYTDSVRLTLTAYRILAYIPSVPILFIHTLLSDFKSLGDLVVICNLSSIFSVHLCRLGELSSEYLSSLQLTLTPSLLNSFITLTIVKELRVEIAVT